VIYDRNSTNLCLHQRFAPYNDSYKALLLATKKSTEISDDKSSEFITALLNSQIQMNMQTDLIRQAITDLLSKANGQILRINDLRTALVSTSK
jgi:hypothetical protein